MSNVAKVLKAEISRISRKEAKTAVGDLGKSYTRLRKIVSDLKRKVAFLEKENRRMVATNRKYRAESTQTLPEEAKKVRLTSRGVRSLRTRLHLTQSDFAKLLGTTAHSVYLWEKKGGALRLRDKAKAALLSIRELGARGARTKLAEAVTKRNRRRTVATKKRKTS